ncbi:hypothetical protein F5877DRAFT_70760 [Lentinula edodes]|nr:hypothetical protein F5877DRAFT_70760 [Lentinula edodes]
MTYEYKLRDIVQLKNVSVGFFCTSHPTAILVLVDGTSTSVRLTRLSLRLIPNATLLRLKDGFASSSRRGHVKRPRRSNYRLLQPVHVAPSSMRLGNSPHLNALTLGTFELQCLYDIRHRRAISDADGEGYLYAYVDSNEVKVGMTTNFNRRKEEWVRDCPYIGRIWLPPLRVANRRRAETLAHLLLEMACTNRPRMYCQSCHRTHFEKFIFCGPWPVAWWTIIYPILLRTANP